MRDTNHTPVEGRFNLDIPMPHVHMTAPEMESMGLDPDEYFAVGDTDMQLVYFGNTAHATYDPAKQEYYMCIDRSVYTFRGMDVVKMCNMLCQHMEQETVLVPHLNRFTWTWANTVANNLDHDRFWSEVMFLFDQDGTTIDNMAGEGDDMFQFHVNDYQIFGLRHPEDDYRMIQWVDGEAVEIGHYPTLTACHKAMKMRKVEAQLRQHTIDASTLIIDAINNRVKS